MEPNITARRPIKRVLMLLVGRWESDSRVVREATAIAQDGHDVHVVSYSNYDTNAATKLDGVTYHSCIALDTATLALSAPRMIALRLRVIGTRALMLGREGEYALAGRVALHLSVQTLASVLVQIYAAPILCMLGILYAAGFLLEKLEKATPHAKPPFLVRLTNWLISRFWLHIYWMLGAVGFDSIRYLDQISVPALRIAQDVHPHIVHAHDLATLSSGYLIARKTGGALIYDAHELETQTNYWGLSSNIRWWIDFYEKTLSRKADAVVTVCDSIADWLQDRYSICRPIVVHNSPDFSQPFPKGPHKPSVRATLGLSERDPLAVYVGSVTIDRGIEQCIEALAFAPGLHLALIGPRYSEIEKKVHTIAERLQATSRVHLIDPIAPHEVTHFVRDADCSIVAIQNVCLSYYFCFPNKLLESVLAGVPVVVSRLVELEKFVHRFKVGMIADETDPRAIATAIQVVIQNREKFRPTSAVREEIASIYGWSAQREKLLSLYARLTP